MNSLIMSTPNSAMLCIGATFLKGINNDNNLMAEWLWKEESCTPMLQKVWKDAEVISLHSSLRLLVDILTLSGVMHKFFSLQCLNVES